MLEHVVTLGQLGADRDALAAQLSDSSRGLKERAAYQRGGVDRTPKQSRHLVGASERGWRWDAVQARLDARRLGKAQLDVDLKTIEAMLALGKITNSDE